MPLEVANESGLIRQKTLEVTKRFKACWIELGQYLYTILQDKYYKEWGYMSFDGYCGKELGIGQSTASKLLKSYHFLEKEEPELIQLKSMETSAPTQIPSYESVHLLRLASQNKNLVPEDVAEIRKSVIEDVREPKAVKAQVKQLIAERAEEKDPAGVRQARRNFSIRRLISMINNAQQELEPEQLLPNYLLKQMKALADKLKDQLQ